MRIARVFGVLAAILTAACGPPPTTGPADATAVEANGPTAKLQRIEGRPVYNLERVSDILNPLTRASVAVSALGQLTVSGWAVDQVSKSRAGGVDVAIDDKAYRAEYELIRQDVAEHFRVPGYARTGFRLSLAAAAIGKGRHRLAVRVISMDGTRYWEGDSLILEIL